ncbi:helix-turn-helix domain-containing protein [Streptomyces tanashiensis]|uniref:helix-turn-helix domain-containing protein n=1 Tax=Streptomyces tanashiensis TaxID=67367 RepID=UPI00341AB495
MGQRRERARTLLAQRPGATLREIAEKAGVSISTVHRLRQTAQDAPVGDLAPEENVLSGTDGVPREDLAATSTRRGRLPCTSYVTSARTPTASSRDAARARALRVLSNDPSVRFTDSGRRLLRWLSTQSVELAAGEMLLATVPDHCVHAVAEVASHYAKEWERLADVLQQGGRRLDASAGE